MNIYLKIYYSSMLVVALLILLPRLVIGAEPVGAVDPTFKSGSGFNGDVYATISQNDAADKVIVAGFFSTHNNTKVMALARLNSDGTLDTTFNAGGTGANAQVTTLARQADGKILIAGSFTSYNGVTRNQLARLNSDGTLDTTFNPGNICFNFSIATLVVQTDGKILLGGQFNGNNEILHNYIARLNSDGTLDATFDTGSPWSRANKPVKSIALQDDGKILIGGQFTSYNGVARNGIARLNSDGSLDSSFTVGSGANNTVDSVAVQSDGKILIGGSFTSYNNTPRKYITRLHSDGSLDTSFNPNGSGTNIYVYSVALQSDGKILLRGAFSTYNGVARKYIARLNEDGTLDTSFTVASGADKSVQTLFAQSDGKVLVGGNFTSYNGVARNRFARLNGDGSLDTDFNPGGSESGANYYVYDVATQPDGKILIGGYFTTYNGLTRRGLARLNSDGTLDSSFVQSGTGFDIFVACIVVQNDGKIIVGGSFTSYNGIPRNRVARLNNDGTLDTSFGSPSGGADAYIDTLALQNDGKIVIGGNFTSYDGMPRRGVARLNSDGTLDTSFNPGTGINKYVHSVALQNDGKILLGGDFTSYNNTPRESIVRLNSDGSLDTSFIFKVSEMGTYYQVYSIAVQTDGKILLGGDFRGPGIPPQGHIARLNGDGTRDTSFNPNGAGANRRISSVVVQADGKILLGGDFTSYNNIPRGYIARLNSNGTLDSSFSPAPANYHVADSAVQSDGKIVIVGGFTAVGSSTRDYVARLEGDSPPAPNITLLSNPNPGSLGESTTFTATVTPFESSGTVTFTFGIANSSVSVTGTLTNGVATYVTNTLPLGDTPVQASYSKAGNSPLILSPVYTQTVSKIATHLSLGSSSNPTVTSTSVTFTVRVLPRIASGTVTFNFNGLPIIAALVEEGGVARYVTNTLDVGMYTVTATYSGDGSHSSSNSSEYLQAIIPPCTPQVVSSPLDDGQATTCGTLSHALATTTNGTISFSLISGNIVSFTANLTPTLAPGVALTGGAIGTVLEGNGVSGVGLRLAGNNALSNLTIRGFRSRQLVVLPGTGPSRLYRVRIEG